MTRYRKWYRTSLHSFGTSSRFPIQPDGLIHFGSSDGAFIVNDTIVRTLLDMQLSMTYKPTAGVPVDGWWSRIQAAVAVGVSSGGVVTWPQVLTSTDPSVILTGYLVPRENPGERVANEGVLMMNNSVPWESRGSRKSPDLTQPPAVRVSISYGSFDFIGEGGGDAIPLWAITGYLRVLVESDSPT